MIHLLKTTATFGHRFLTIVDQFVRKTKTVYMHIEQFKVCTLNGLLHVHREQGIRSRSNLQLNKRKRSDTDYTAKENTITLKTKHSETF